MKRILENIVVTPVVTFCTEKDVEIIYLPKVVVDREPSSWYEEKCCIQEKDIESLLKLDTIITNDTAGAYYFKRMFQEGKIKFPSAKTTISKSDKIYVSKKCNIPRYKLRDYLSEGGAITRKPESANLIVLPEDALAPFMDSQMFYIMSKELFLDHVKQRFASFGSREFTPIEQTHINRLMKLIDAIKTNPTEYFFVRMNLADREMLRETLLYAPEDFTRDGDLRDLSKLGRLDTASAAFFTAENMSYLDDICKTDIIFQNDVLNVLGAAELNEEAYKTICEMFDGHEISNHNLALNIMINCNFEASIYYLLKIFNEYEYKIKRSDLRTTVGYKSLRDFIAPFGSHLTPDSMYDAFKKYDQLNPKNVELLKKFTLDYIDRTTRHTMTNFVITDLIIKDLPEQNEPETIEVEENVDDLA